MEVVDVPAKRTNVPYCDANSCPCKIRCTKRYVQPPREKSFAPARSYNPAVEPLEARTTYHLSYLNVDDDTARHARSQPFRPTHCLGRSDGRFSGDTTTNLSYKPVWGYFRARPITPKPSKMGSQGRMEDVTTSRHDYVAKFAEKPAMLVPCGSIRTSSGPFDANTTAALSYMNPGPVEPTANFKPVRKYCPPAEALPKDTTQKLSYQPFVVPRKEVHPWSLKPGYKSPELAMCGKTVYSESYLENKGPVTAQPIRPPRSSDVLPRGSGFAADTVYKQSYLPCAAERVGSIVPCASIAMPEGKMLADTINKMSYKPVRGEKRDPYLPRSRSMIGAGPMESETTNRHDFAAKTVAPPRMIVPCSNIRTSGGSLEARTTTGLSYMKPGPVEPVQNFKPVTKYCKPSEKIDAETVNKLSYQPWTPLAKEELPWAKKSRYSPPKDKLSGDTVYHMSYPAPGYYIEDCTDVDCPCIPEERDCQAPPPAQTCH